MIRLRRTAAVVVAVTGVLVTSACANVGRVPAPPAPPGYVRELILPAENGTAVQSLVNYNPYSLTPLTSTWLYEPLLIRDQYSCAWVPWLATKFDWTDTKTLVFTIRQGVKWSDGQTLSAADVAFTLNRAKKYPGMDRAGLWSATNGAAATSVTASGDTVTIRFAGNASAKLDPIVSTMPILPEHVYGGVGDITKYVDKKPVGTGPFVVKAYNGRRLVLERNPDYWQASKIKVQTISEEGVYDANSSALKLRTGALDLYQGDIPNPVASVRREGSTDFDYSPAGTTVLAPNNQRAPMSDVKFREAMAYAIDKTSVSRDATYGVMKVASQTMLKLPLQQADLPAADKASGGYVPYDPKKAEALLDAAGYKAGKGGFRSTPSGKPISLVFTVQAGFIDYLAMASVIVRNLNAVGIRTSEVVTDPNSVDTQRKNGNFDLALDYVGGTCNRVVDLGGHLQTSDIPKAKDAAVNLNTERFSDASVDKLVAAWEGTTDPAQQRRYQDEVIGIYTSRFPVIALQYAPQRLIFNTQVASGWPSATNRYPTDKLLYLITHLRAKG